MNLLSIVIPVYNAKETLERTLVSLGKIEQGSRHSCEVIIVNDGSTDGSMDVVDGHKTLLESLNYSIISQENRGLAGARRAALERCEGEWVFLLDADDELEFDPVPFARESPDASALTFSVIFRKDMGSPSRRAPGHVTSDNHLDILTARNPLTASSLVFKRNKIESPFDEGVPALEDWLFWLMNPGLFENVKRLADIVSATIHLRAGSLSQNRPQLGQCKQIVAEKVTARFGNKLTTRQRNNLRIQSYVGTIMRGEKAPLRRFTCLPCDPLLYVKLLLYSSGLADSIESLGLAFTRG